MEDQQNGYNYLRGKFTQWYQETGRLEKHVDPRKRAGIAAEFRQDLQNVKANVCPYIKDAGYFQSKSLIVKAAEGFVGIFFGFPLYSTADIILQSLIDVCGFVRRGDNLVERGL
jgi:hypothetical protein